MQGGYVTVVAFAAMVVVAFAEDHPIRPIPTECPLVDSKDFTVHLKHEYDCTKYYACSRGSRIEMSCPYMNKRQQLHFNALLQVCDWPQNAGCAGETTNTIAEPTPSTTVAWNTTWDCSFAPDGTLLPHETRCHLYYKCENHRPVQKECAEGLYFDPYRQICNIPSESRCPITNPCKDYKKSEGTYYPDPTSCQHVYYCKGYTTTRYVCDVDAGWSVKEEQCVLKEKANCVRRFDY